MSDGGAAHRLFLVASASHAIKGESALKRAGVFCRLVPVPRSLSSQCGVCLRVELSAGEQAEEVLRAALIEVSAIHDVRSDRG